MDVASLPISAFFLAPRIANNFPTSAFKTINSVVKNPTKSLGVRECGTYKSESNSATNSTSNPSVLMSRVLGLWIGDTGFALHTGDANGNADSGMDSTGSGYFVGSAEAKTAGQVDSGAKN
jgi:hypothetical protein